MRSLATSLFARPVNQSKRKHVNKLQRRLGVGSQKGARRIRAAAGRSLGARPPLAVSCCVSLGIVASQGTKISRKKTDARAAPCSTKQLRDPQPRARTHVVNQVGARQQAHCIRTGVFELSFLCVAVSCSLRNDHWKDPGAVMRWQCVKISSHTALPADCP